MSEENKKTILRLQKRILELENTVSLTLAILQDTKNGDSIKWIKMYDKT
ncbi:MAG: hypothetical protein GY782_08650 [Gammaproteobacteria bacterium]|nr:hypothetical protein [Gammaproteobacteria bacterium]